MRSVRFSFKILLLGDFERPPRIECQSITPHTALESRTKHAHSHFKLLIEESPHFAHFLVEMSGEWTKHRDETYQTDYWYNEATGESSWTEPTEAATESARAIIRAQEGGVELDASEIDGEEVGERDALLTSAAVAVLSSHPSSSKSNTLSNHHHPASGFGSGGGRQSSDIARVSLLLHADRVYADTGRCRTAVHVSAVSAV